jgi:hypothetical protein
LSGFYDRLSGSAQARSKGMRITGWPGEDADAIAAKLRVISVADKAQMAEIGSLEKFITDEQHFEYEGFRADLIGVCGAQVLSLLSFPTQHPELTPPIPATGLYLNSKIRFSDHPSVALGRDSAIGDSSVARRPPRNRWQRTSRRSQTGSVRH